MVHDSVGSPAARGCPLAVLVAAQVSSGHWPCLPAIDPMFRRSHLETILTTHTCPLDPDAAVICRKAEKGLNTLAPDGEISITREKLALGWDRERVLPAAHMPPPHPSCSPALRVFRPSSGRPGLWHFLQHHPVQHCTRCHHGTGHCRLSGVHRCFLFRHFRCGPAWEVQLTEPAPFCLSLPPFRLFPLLHRQP